MEVEDDCVLTYVQVAFCEVKCCCNVSPRRNATSPHVGIHPGQLFSAFSFYLVPEIFPLATLQPAAALSCRQHDVIRPVFVWVVFILSVLFSTSEHVTLQVIGVRPQLWYRCREKA
jgi:hypothetical protein